MNRRLALEQAEVGLVRGAMSVGLARDPHVDRLRYVLSVARLDVIRNVDDRDVDVAGPLDRFAGAAADTWVQRLADAPDPRAWRGEVDAWTQRAVALREAVLEHLPVDAPSFDAEVTTRALCVASGGGGGAGYVYPGCYEVLDRAGLTPDLMAGTSIGSLMGLFRARRRRWDMAPLVAAARRLSWTGVFRALNAENRYGLPATLRLYLRGALGELFRTDDDSRGLWLSDMEIPFLVVVTGITMDALKHDLSWYEHLLDDEVARGGTTAGVRAVFKGLALLREFASRRDALIELILGHTPGTQDFDVLDAAGFSSSIPGIIHYDVIRDDPRMKRLLDDLYARFGVARLGEGGIVQNVPARACWEAVRSGRLGRRNAFVLALDCFAPDPRRPAWFPIQQLVRSANVDGDRDYAHLYVPLAKTLSPVHLVPSLRDAMTAIRWGRAQLEPHVPFLQEMMRPLSVPSAG